MEQWTGVLQVLGGLVAIFATGFGVAKLIENRQLRRYKKEDDQRALDSTNESERLKSDSDFRKDLIKRVDQLEKKSDALQEKFVELTKTNAVLETENKNHVKDKERLEQLVKELSESDVRKSERIRILEKELHEAQAILNTLKEKIAVLEKGLNEA